MTNGTSSLVVIETSHSIRNTALYKKLSQQTVFSWIRSVVANALASDGAEWAALFSAYHSGTYNNEWQVIGAFYYERRPRFVILTFLLPHPPSSSSKIFRFDEIHTWGRP